MKKVSLFLFTTFVLLFCKINVNGQPDERQERFHAQKVAYFTDKMQLTSSEAEKFWPLYNDYVNRKSKFEEESRSILRYLNRNSENMKDQEIIDSLEKYMGIQDNLHALPKDFHNQYLKILPPQKVARLYTTEVQFRAFLLNQIREVRQDKRPRRF